MQGRYSRLGSVRVVFAVCEKGLGGFDLGSPDIYGQTDAFHAKPSRGLFSGQRQGPFVSLSTSIAAHSVLLLEVGSDIRHRQNQLRPFEHWQFQRDTRSRF